MESYDYAHRDGVLWVSWEDFDGMTKALAEKLAVFQPDVIIGIARAGLFPAAAVAGILRREIYPIRLSRRMNDQVVRERPAWIVPIMADVRGKVVIIIDEIADTGETLAIAAGAVREHKPDKVITACLVSHHWADPAPDVRMLVSDALMIFPWDRQVFSDGRWVPNPELVAALEAQGLSWEDL